MIDYIDSFDVYVALVWQLKQIEAAKKRALARSAWPYDHDDLAPADVVGHTSEDVQLPEVFVQVSTLIIDSHPPLNEPDQPAHSHGHAKIYDGDCYPSLKEHEVFSHQEPSPGHQLIVPDGKYQ